MRRALLVALVCLGAATGCGGGEHDAREEPARRAPTPRPHVPLDARLARHIDSLAHAGGHRSRVALTDGNAWSVGYVARELRAAGAAVTVDSLDGLALANVVGVIAGDNDSVVVIGAHLDASASRDRGWRRRWSSMPAPGAVDNASGVAALIEIARAVTALGTPRYTLEIAAYNAEEYSPSYGGHHHGSLHHARRLKREGRRLKGAIVLDMVTSNRAHRRVELFASGRSHAFAREIEATHARLRSPLELARAGSACSRSDNESFDRVGLPVVLLMESCAPWRTSHRHPRFTAYHSSKDTPEKVNRDVLADVVHVVTAFVAPARPPLATR